MFINNQVAIKLEDLDQVSLSDIYNCTFVSDDDWQIDGGGPLYFIELNNYCNYGQLEISACKFINNAVDHQSVKGKGYGIYSTNSSFTVDQLCVDNNYPCNEYIGCSFENLEYGIYASATRQGGLPITITNSEFTNNTKGIYIGTINNACITSNEFRIKKVTENYGLYLDYCTGYQVENNNFYGEGDLQSNPRENYGLYVNNSGRYDNLIYRNYFENLYYASAYQDINRITAPGNTGGLCVKCNDFVNNIYDIFIKGNYGIAAFQGSQVPIPPINDPSTYPAGNTFTGIDYDPLKNNIDNNANQISYFYHEDDGGYNIFPDPVFGVGRIEVEEVQYNKPVSCPPNTSGGGSIESLKSDLTYYSFSIDSIVNELQILVDNSDTDGLNFNVQTAMPSQSIETRNLLLQSSPNLSDTVMLSAIEVENVLPNSMVRDVLVENPQAAKSQKIQAALDNRTNTMPDYMRDHINVGLDTLSVVENIRAQLSVIKQQHALAFNKLHYLYNNDTTIININDSLMNLYNTTGGLFNKYRMAWLYFMEDDTISSDSILNNIQYEFELTSDQENERQDYFNYMQIIRNMKNDNLVYPDSIAISQLFSLINSFNGMPPVYARNMLHWAGEIVYNEPLLKADTSLKTTIIYHAGELEIGLVDQDKFFIIKPNPAHDYFIVSYKLPSNNTSGCYISIADIHGRLINRIKIVDEQNEIVINAFDWQPGSYIVSLIINNKIYESQKLNIIK